MKVTLIAYTVMNPLAVKGATDGKYQPHGNRASDLAEFAGRVCYESWKRPNPETATVEGYCNNIIKQEHFSVFEHGSASFYITGVSRSLTHELIRHRHLSYSQQSQRYVDVASLTADDLVSPPELVADSGLQDLFEASVSVYKRLVSGMEPLLGRKRARQAARAALLNCTPTHLVVTGNHRSWREVLLKRGSLHADVEIREMALKLWAELSILEPELYQDIWVRKDNGMKFLTLDPDAGDPETAW